MIDFAFLHIPKTAGTAVGEALRGLAPERAILPKGFDRRLFGTFSDWEGIPKFNRDRILLPHEIERLRAERYQIAAGHLSLDTLRRLGARTIAVVFREPRARILSHYTYWRSWPPEEHASWGSCDLSRKAAALSLADFVADPALFLRIDNLMSRLLLPGWLLPDEGPLRRSGRPLYELALRRRLRSMSLIGFQEDLEAFRCGLSALLGRELDFQRVNETTRVRDVGQFDTRAAALLEERTWLDAWLYDEARRLAGAEERGGPRARDAVYRAARDRYGFRCIRAVDRVAVAR